MEQIRKEWHSASKKTIPDDMSLNPIALAAWIGQPGLMTIDDDNCICVHSKWHAESDSNKLIKLFKSTYDIDATIKCSRGCCSGKCLSFDKDNSKALIKHVKKDPLIAFTAPDILERFEKK